MPDANDWNEQTIAEFRANGGHVGGTFEGAPLVLVHHRGRKSGRDYVNPTMYLPDERDDNTIYIFASKGGASSHPDWYYNQLILDVMEFPESLWSVAASSRPSWGIQIYGGAAIFADAARTEQFAAAVAQIQMQQQ